MYKRELNKLLKPIKFNHLLIWASFLHGHIKTDDGRDLLPFRYLRYEFELADKEHIYDEFFKKHEEDGGNQLASFEYPYRYYDVSLFEQTLKNKLIPIDRSEQLFDLAKKCGEQNCKFELYDDNKSIRFFYKTKKGGTCSGNSTLTKKFLQDFKKEAINF